MFYNSVNGSLFKGIVLNGYNNLIRDMAEINNLNVFPVPDGDTGTNMKKTLENGINNLTFNDGVEEQIGEVSDILAKGMLLGARGNSRVILSQYFKGIAKHLVNKNVATVNDMVEAFIEGYKTAYNAVVTPTEGTILTVAREGIELVKNQVTDKTSFNELLDLMYKRMEQSLEETPEKLFVLKEAGVVDSGGAGLISIFKGMICYLNGEKIDYKEDKSSNTVTFNPSLFNADSELHYGYCTEFILQLLNKKCNPSEVKIDDFIGYLSTIGDSIVAIKDSDIIKIHVHTKTPSKAIEFAQKYGEFITFKMENMAIQNNEVNAKKNINKVKVHKKTAYVAVANGDGVQETFKELNCDTVLNGGQTMNTSCEEFIEAFKELDADNIIVLPNNKNIVMAANQAKEMYKDANVYVIPTRSIAEGYYSLSMMIDPNAEIEDQIASMSDGIEDFITAEVTYSIRDTILNGLEIKKGNYIGIVNHSLVSTNEDVLQCLKDMIDAVPDFDEKSIVTIFVGQSADGTDAVELKKYIESKNKYIDIGIINGQQDVYDFILGIC